VISEQRREEITNQTKNTQIMETNYMEMSHPEQRGEMQEMEASLGEQLIAVAREIDAHRDAAEKSQNAWCKMWSRLGAQKAYSQILKGDLSEVAVAKRLPDFRAVLAAIRAQVGSTGAEPLYGDLPGAEAVTLATLRIMHHEGKDRLILVLGGSGSGKTSALEVLAAEGAGGSRLIRLEADESWKSPRAALRRMLIAAGCPRNDVPGAKGEMLEELIHLLNLSGRCILAVDEAHHVSGTVLNLFKTLLNRTSARIILAGMNTLFAKLRANASEEATQLIHNRLFERVDLTGPDADTARMFLSRRLGGDGGWKAGTLAGICGVAKNCGHWSFLRRIVDQLRSSGTTAAHAASDADLMAAADAARREIA
jgi:hypothetical protein